jgi:hypothetical protein
MQYTAHRLLTLVAVCATAAVDVHGFASRRTATPVPLERVQTAGPRYKPIKSGLPAPEQKPGGTQQQSVREQVGKFVQVSRAKDQFRVIVGPRYSSGNSLTSKNIAPYATIPTAHPENFFSYARKDAGFVQQFVRQSQQTLRVTGFGLTPVMDTDFLGAGDRWQTAIAERIVRAEMFTLLWSHNAAQSSYVQSELDLALRVGKPVRPVFWENPMPAPPPLLKRAEFLFAPELSRPPPEPAGDSKLPQAFVSYDPGDRQVAEQLAANMWSQVRLTGLGYRPVLWDFDSRPQADRESARQWSIRQSQLFILLWSEKAEQSSHVANDINSALDGNIRIRPVRWNLAMPPEKLNDLHFLTLPSLAETSQESK